LAQALLDKASSERKLCFLPRQERPENEDQRCQVTAKLLKRRLSGFFAPVRGSEELAEELEVLGCLTQEVGPLLLQNDQVPERHEHLLGMVQCGLLEFTDLAASAPGLRSRDEGNIKAAIDALSPWDAEQDFTQNSLELSHLSLRPIRTGGLDPDSDWLSSARDARGPRMSSYSWICRFATVLQPWC